METTEQKALKVFFNIALAWGITPAQEAALLGEDEATIAAWRGKITVPNLSQSAMEGLGHVFRIYGALEVLLPERERADRWVFAVNSAPNFDGKRAIDHMLAGHDGLKMVADYLDGQSGGFGYVFPQTRTPVSI